MTTIFQKQSFLAVSALALMAGVALSVPNSVSAANLITYDFEFKVANNVTDSGFITVDKDNKSIGSDSYTAPYNYDYSIWYQSQWVDFGFEGYTKADAKADALFYTVDIQNDSILYPDLGSSLRSIFVQIKDLTLFGFQDDYAEYAYIDTFYGYGDRRETTSFTITPRSKAVPVPGFAFGIVAAGGWLASKQLRRKTQTAKQSVSV